MRTGALRNWVALNADFFLDLIRIYLGTGLFVKGIFLMGHREFLMQTIDQAGSLWFAPAVVAHYIIPAHLLGGPLLALGLLTRIAALVNIPVLLGALFYVYLPHVAQFEPRQNLEFSALVLFLLAVFSIYGAGRFSLDALLARGEGSAKPQVLPPGSAEARH
jgi:uncharacterized membrane protein YphA (DoxX/SURF4 family)